MSGYDTVDALLTRKLDGIRALRHIKSVEVFDEAEMLEWGHIFRWQLQGFANLSMQTLGYVLSRARHGKVVNLAQQEHFSTLKIGGAGGLVMCGALEAELWRSQDSSNVFFLRVCQIRDGLGEHVGLEGPESGPISS